MSSLHYQALSGRRKSQRSSPFVSAIALMAIAALPALVQSVRTDDGVTTMRAAKQAVADRVLGS